MEYFLRCVAENRAETEISEQSTLAVAKICSACHESGSKGVPVDIEWTEGEIPEGYVMAKLKN